MKLIARFFGFLLTVALVGAIAGFVMLSRYAIDLPDYQELATHEYPAVTRVLASDGRLLAEYAIEKRVFVPIRVVPKKVIDAFLSAEDKTFYEHPGIDIPGIVRAALTNFRNAGKDRRPVGASTITQQVAKNFLLGGEVSIERKIKEAILAFRIEQTYSKDRILELYLNQIYLGQGSYGVVAAALNYFNKTLDELTLSEVAYLAGLPKAPNNYNLVLHPDEAVLRRNYVIGRMLEDGKITKEQADQAMAEPLRLRQRDTTESVTADYFAEEVRREIAADPQLGQEKLYKGGLYIRSSLDPKLQELADRVLRAGLVRYDQRHGYRGPVQQIDPGPDWQKRLAAVPLPIGLYDWRLAMVIDAGAPSLHVGFADGSEGTMPLAELKWAQRAENGRIVGKAIAKASDALQPGDVVMAEKVTTDASNNPYPADTYALRQIPEVSGAMVVMDPHTGRVFAMTGGWSYQQSEFNRATQAYRQPGSSFKPIVYMAALDSGYTPSTIVLDAPISIDQGPGLPLWTPENYGGDYIGPATMRVGIEKSRNLMTVRVAQAVGMQKVVEYAKKLGVVDDLMPTLAMALGAGETTPLRMVTAYSQIVNGGKKIKPTFIDRIQDRLGRTIYRHDDRPCDDCRAAWNNQAVPSIPDTREQILDPRTAYQMVSILEGVVQRGTGVAVSAVGKPLAGKTGTTNDSKDAWFVGFSPDLAAAVYVGYDSPQSLGGKETGGAIAAPIFRDFMKEALADKPATPFRVPPGIRLVRVNLKTGQRPAAGDEGPVILEAYKPGTEPNGEAVVIDGSGDSLSGTSTAPAAGPPSSTGGLY
ncbi:MAG TPA: penicillin-binding protein 1A [Methylomirabilota bacterium]|nr:penicillin-binding protein 1A [Methylomirabilota bacterium]